MEALESVVVLDSRRWAELPSRSVSLHPFRGHCWFCLSCTHGNWGSVRRPETRNEDTPWGNKKQKTPFLRGYATFPRLGAEVTSAQPHVRILPPTSLHMSRGPQLLKPHSPRSSPHASPPPLPGLGGRWLPRRAGASAWAPPSGGLGAAKRPLVDTDPRSRHIFMRAHSALVAGNPTTILTRPRFKGLQHHSGPTTQSLSPSVLVGTRKWEELLFSSHLAFRGSPPKPRPSGPFTAAP